jgi:hypothetical protein
MEPTTTTRQGRDVSGRLYRYLYRPSAALMLSVTLGSLSMALSVGLQDLGAGGATAIPWRPAGSLPVLINWSSFAEPDARFETDGQKCGGRARWTAGTVEERGQLCGTATP